MREYYEVLKRVDRGEKVRCVPIGHIRTNIISWEKPAVPGIFFLEPPSVPDVNTGEIEPQDYF